MLTKGELTLYLLLSENSISSFVEMVDVFFKTHIWGTEGRERDVIKIQQGDSELLQDFMDLFHRERMLFLKVPDN